MTTKRDRLEIWVARRLRSAFDDLGLAHGDIGELTTEGRRPGTKLPADVRAALERIESEIAELRARVSALSPLPIADAE